MAEQAGPRARGKSKQAQPIRACFFGHFRVTVGDVVVNDSASRARQPWYLLQYLMMHRHQPVTRQQLIEALWPDGNSDQPDKALKNLVYRVRSAFAAKGVPGAQDVVLYRGGNYVLNNDLDWWFDFEEAEAHYRVVLDEARPAGVRMDAALAAIELYRGDFLSEQEYEDWVLPYNTYYRSRFFQCARLALDLLEGTDRVGDREFICNRAVTIDPFSEAFHLAYMRILVEQGKHSTALTHYSKMAEMFFREMGVTPGDELRTLYAELGRGMQTAVTDLQSIKDSLGEDNAGNDAFYCDFEVFRSLYRLEARAAQRAGQAVFVALFTLNDADGPMAESETLTRCMGLLLNLIHECLRRGDVVSRFSPCQYILLLPTITVENATMVVGRVADRFARLSPGPDVALESSVQPLDAIME